MAMEVIKSPLQPASQGAGGNYGKGTVSSQVGNSCAENCNPNTNKEGATPGKSTAKKTPVKSKSTTLSENDLGKSPVRRRLDCDGGAYESGMPPKSPAKTAFLKEVGTAPHKHFCRSPRCAANNPDYAIPAPRQYLKSKRHLLPGWHPPLNSKLRTAGSSMPGENATQVCSINNHEDLGEHTHEEDTSVEPSNGNLLCGTDVKGNFGQYTDGEEMPAEPSNANALFGIVGEHTQADALCGMLDSKCNIEGDPSTVLLNVVEHLDTASHVEDEEADFKNRGIEFAAQRPMLPISDREDLVKNMNAVGDISSEDRSNDVEVLSAEGPLSSGQIGAESEDTSMIEKASTHRAEPTLESRVTLSSDFSMRSIGEEGSGSRRDTYDSSRPPRRKYHKIGGRRLSSGTSSIQSVSLIKQDGLKRKQAEDWMWDAAIKDAVQRFAPQGTGGVNVLVQAFETVKLTEDEIQRAKYKNMAVGRLVLKNSPFQGGYTHATSTSGAVEPDVSQMETITSINKVHAWDESMASRELIDESISHEFRQDDEYITLTPQKMKSNFHFTSKSEPPKLRGIGRSIVSDESMHAKDDTHSERGAPSSSGKSGITEWTCERKSQAGRMRKQKLKRCTSLHPFRLRTEERGAMKEYMFSKRVQQLWDEEERLRIPIAQGLPWTTDEPAIPPKPAVKEQTKPEGFRLITDVRAVERAEFDGYIAERDRQMELQRQEEERQRQIAEEEEVRRLRREMVPRAQLMPYFDRPFMPRRSSKKLTVPKDPKFHLKQNKRARCMSTVNLSTA